MIKLFNTLTRTKQGFRPVDALVRMYACGPTVYNFVHIGNLRTFLFEDVLRRWLKFRGFKVKLVKNLTDVDDKTIRDSQKERLSLKDFTEKYTVEFFKDVDSLRLERADVYPKATEHIKEMVVMTQCLLKKGLVYKTSDGIYFSISKFKKYGELAHLDLAGLQAGSSGRVLADEYEKENVADFALWKFWDVKDGDVFWETELGKGRPGWHIECSAMSAKHLTGLFEDGFDRKKFKTIDIHTGGIDLLFPHHQDEVAQTEGCVGKKFAKYWLHAEHLLVDGKKMSKSLGNFYTLRDILAKGYNPLAVRYVLLSSHYRQKMNFTFEALDGAVVVVQRLNDFVLRLKEAHAELSLPKVEKLVAKAKKKFDKSMDDDLEISPALAAVFDLMNSINKLLDAHKLSRDDAQKVLHFMHDVDKVLAVLQEDAPLSPELERLLAERESARSLKNFARADELRDELRKHGIVVEDTSHGQRWKRVL
ncbi:cysteine--tRNA ligase [Candidatus Woesearchaeota archaeon]|nr:cysteine--tRNA ligase [Candidatus Woesearchaeota archaeon]